MRNLTRQLQRNALAVAIALALPMTAMADAAYDELKQQVDMLQKQLELVQAQLKKVDEQAASKKEVQQMKAQVAEVTTQQSEWKSTDSVVHLAGYGDVTYSNSDSDGDNGAFSGARFNPIFHYQYKDKVMLEAELEFAVDGDGATEVAVEYVTVDYFVNDYLALIGGQFMSPLGQFRQNLHPTWINKLTSAPPGFGHDQAAPISDTGLMARGGFPMGSTPIYANYAAYVANGPILEIEGDEIEAIEAAGRTSNEDGKYVWGGRLGVIPVPGLELGLSLATGKAAGETETAAIRDYDVIGFDAAYRLANLGLRGEYIEQSVGSSNRSESPDSVKWRAAYVQAAYRLLPTKWEAVARYTDYDSPHDSIDQKQVALGVNYRFAPSAVMKLGYHFNDGENGSKADSDVLQLQFAYGF